MPCNCDHLEESKHELESKKVMTFLKEVGLHKGEVPFYGEVENIHKHTEQLCTFLKDNDSINYSLELQIWWRDHKISDEAKSDD